MENVNEPHIFHEASFEELSQESGTKKTSRIGDLLIIVAEKFTGK